MQELQPANIIVQQAFESLCSKKEIPVAVLRLDRIHPVIAGNKWFKLRYYLDDAKQQNKQWIVTFGGAWSNHIVAAACASAMNGMQSIGIIRGEEPAVYSSTLKAAAEYGMQFYFISREDYREKKIPGELNKDNVYLIPEGGYGEKGAEGFATAMEYCDKNNFTHFLCAVGTGTMMAGIIKTVSDKQEVIGIPVLKNNPELLPAVKSLLSATERTRNFRFFEEYHFGGYAKHTNELLSFMNSFYKQNSIPTDFVYTGKLFFAANDLLRKNYFKDGSKILLIHSGGLQGNTSLPAGTLIF